jgi:O-antigen/teichoic acid export membrane protein
VATFKTIPEQRLKAAENATGAVVLRSGKTVVDHATRLVAVVGLSMGVVGYLLGSLVAAVAIGAVGTAYLLRRALMAFSVEKMRAALTYSLPMFPHFYSHFVISMADRVLLSRLGTLGAVGVYTLGYSLARVLQMLVTSANNAIMPEFAAASGDDEAFGRLADIATYYLLLAAVVAVGFSLFMPVALELFFPAAYQDAARILPWLAVGFFCLSLYYVPMNVLSQTQRETRYVPILTIVAAVSNIGLNYLLIPEYGITGAAVSTLVAYLLLAIMVFVLSQRFRPVAYEYRRVGIVVVALVAVVGMLPVVPEVGVVLGVLVRVALLGLFAAIVTGLGFWTPEEKAAARRGLRALVDRMPAFR